MAELETRHLLAGVILISAGALFYVAAKGSGGWNAPRNLTEDAYLTASPVNRIQPHPQAGYLYTCHRYPQRVGHEITTLIQGGHSAASVPRYADQACLITRPPSEATL